jgi:hypothetical protein
MRSFKRGKQFFQKTKTYLKGPRCLVAYDLVHFTAMYVLLKMSISVQKTRKLVIFFMVPIQKGKRVCTLIVTREPL